MKKTLRKLPKLLADESLGLKVAQNLAKFGFDILAIGNVARGATNGKVLARATDEKRVLVTTDKDFGYLVFKEKLATHGIILLRLKKESIKNLTSCLLRFLKSYPRKLKGKFIVITEEKIRVRKI